MPKVPNVLLYQGQISASLLSWIPNVHAQELTETENNKLDFRRDRKIKRHIFLAFSFHSESQGFLHTCTHSSFWWIMALPLVVIIFGSCICHGVLLGVRSYITCTMYLVVCPSEGLCCALCSVCFLLLWRNCRVNRVIHPGCLWNWHFVALLHLPHRFMQ